MKWYSTPCFTATPSLGESMRNLAHRHCKSSFCTTRRRESLHHLDTERSRPQGCFAAIPLIEASQACASRTSQRLGAPFQQQVVCVPVRPCIVSRSIPSSRPRDTHFFKLPTTASSSSVLDPVYPTEPGAVQSRAWCAARRRHHTPAIPFSRTQAYAFLGYHILRHSIALPPPSYT